MFLKSANSKNIGFLVLFLVVLGIAFGVIQIIGTTDSSSMYNQLFYKSFK